MEEDTPAYEHPPLALDALLSSLTRFGSDPGNLTYRYLKELCGVTVLDPSLLASHSSPVVYLRFSGNLLASYSVRGILMVHNVTTKDLVWRSSGTDFTSSGIASTARVGRPFWFCNGRLVFPKGDSLYTMRFQNDEIADIQLCELPPNHTVIDVFGGGCIISQKKFAHLGFPPRLPMHFWGPPPPAEIPPEPKVFLFNSGFLAATDLFDSELVDDAFKHVLVSADLHPNGDLLIVALNSGNIALYRLSTKSVEKRITISVKQFATISTVTWYPEDVLVVDATLEGSRPGGGKSFAYKFETPDGFSLIKTTSENCGDKGACTGIPSVWLSSSGILWSTIVLRWWRSYYATIPGIRTERPLILQGCSYLILSPDGETCAIGDHYGCIYVKNRAQLEKDLKFIYNHKDWNWISPDVPKIYPGKGYRNHPDWTTTTEENMTIFSPRHERSFSETREVWYSYADLFLLSAHNVGSPDTVEYKVLFNWDVLDVTFEDSGIPILNPTSKTNAWRNTGITSRTWSPALGVITRRQEESGSNISFAGTKRNIDTGIMCSTQAEIHLCRSGTAIYFEDAGKIHLWDGSKSHNVGTRPPEGKWISALGIIPSSDGISSETIIFSCFGDSKLYLSDGSSTIKTPVSSDSSYCKILVNPMNNKLIFGASISGTSLYKNWYTHTRHNCDQQNFEHCLRALNGRTGNLILLTTDGSIVANVVIPCIGLVEAQWHPDGHQIVLSSYSGFSGLMDALTGAVRSIPLFNDIRLLGCSWVGKKQLILGVDGMIATLLDTESYPLWRRETKYIDRSKFSNSLTDIVIEGTGGQRSAHRDLLTVSSEYFSAMFSGAWKETSIISTDASITALNFCVDHLYGLNCDHNLNGDSALEILSLAGQWLLGDVVEKVEAFLAQNVDSETAVELLDRAESFQLRNLKIACLKLLWMSPHTTNNTNNKGIY